MKAKLALAIVLALISPSSGAAPVTATLKFADGSTVVVSAADEIRGTGTPELIIRGHARVKLFDKAAGTEMRSEADTITVVFFPGASAQGAIRSAEMTGSPKITYIAPKIIKDEKTGQTTGQVTVTTEATADNATFDGATGIAHLTGNVKIIQDDPSMWAEPAVLTGDKASVNLKRAPGLGDYDFRIESTTTPSRIEVVPKVES